MKKLLCMILATVLLTSCGTVFTNDSATASGSETYEAYLRENLAAMPKSLIIGDESGGDAQKPHHRGRICGKVRGDQP